MFCSTFFPATPPAVLHLEIVEARGIIRAEVCGRWGLSIHLMDIYCIYPSHLLQPVTPTDQKAKARAGPMEVKQVNHSECMCISGHVACGQMDGHID